MNIREVLRAMVQLRASDLFLKVGGPPQVRVDGTVRQLGNTGLTKDDMKEAFVMLVDEPSRESFRKSHEADTAFEEVMRACAAPRNGQAGTWIHEEMIAAYTALHHMGYAHSVETWKDGELAGGLAVGGVLGAQRTHHTRNPACEPCVPIADIPSNTQNVPVSGPFCGQQGIAFSGSTHRVNDVGL